MDAYLLVLFVTPPLLAIAYAMLEHLGKVDDWTGRRAAVEGLQRLKSASGFPVSWLYDNEHDQLVFQALETRISRHTNEAKIHAALADGHRPTCITVGGLPLALAGVPKEWPVENKRIYTSSHPVMYLFGVGRDGGKGKGDRACTLGELEQWLANEKDRRKYYLGVLAIGIISVTFIVVRFVGTA